MKTSLALGAALVLLSGPALAQYGDGAQNAGGPLGNYARSAGMNYGGYGYGPSYGGYGYYGPAPVYSWGGPAYYGYPGYGGGAVAAGIVGGLALGALAARPYYHPRRIYRPYARAYRRW